MAISKLPEKITGLSPKGLWTLFLISAFPTHVWTIILVLRDFSWLSERTNAWDALGVGAYGLLIAFVESLFVFFVVLLLNFLIRGPWQEEKRIALLSSLILIVSLWAMFNQLHFLLGWSIPDSLFQFLTRQTRPLVIFYLLILGVVGPLVIGLTYFSLKSDQWVRGFLGLIERITILMTLYLVFDGVALILVIIRNL